MDGTSSAEIMLAEWWLVEISVRSQCKISNGQEKIISQCRNAPLLSGRHDCNSLSSVKIPVVIV